MTETTDPQPLRIPIGRNVTYAVRGMPKVANQYGPGFLLPTEISLTYRATEDSQLGRFHAYVKGQWLRDGEQVPSGEKLPGQHYYGDPAGWPEWLAAEARMHDPDAAVPSAPADRTALRADLEEALRGSGVYDSEERMWRSLSQEWIQEILTEVLAVLPVPADRADEEQRLALSEALGLGTGAPWDTIRDRAAELHQAQPAADPSWPRRAWDLGLLHKGGNAHHCPACLKQPEPPANFVCPGDNTEVLANPQPEAQRTGDGR